MQIAIDDQIKITCGTKGALIYYTLDGSTPTEDSTMYSGPFSVEGTCTVKARAFKEGLDPSDVAVAEVEVIQLDQPVVTTKDVYSDTYKDIILGLVMSNKNAYPAEATLVITTNTGTQNILIGDLDEYMEIPKTITQMSCKVTCQGYLDSKSVSVALPFKDYSSYWTNKNLLYEDQVSASGTYQTGHKSYMNCFADVHFEKSSEIFYAKCTAKLSRWPSQAEIGTNTSIYLDRPVNPGVTTHPLPWQDVFNSQTLTGKPSVLGRLDVSEDFYRVYFGYFMGNETTNLTAPLTLSYIEGVLLNITQLGLLDVFNSLGMSYAQMKDFLDNIPVAEFGAKEAPPVIQLKRSSSLFNRRIVIKVNNTFNDNIKIVKFDYESPTGNYSIYESDISEVIEPGTEKEISYGYTWTSPPENVFVHLYRLNADGSRKRQYNYSCDGVPNTYKEYRFTNEQMPRINEPSLLLRDGVVTIEDRDYFNENPTIKYRVDNGAEQIYSSPFNWPAGAIMIETWGTKAGYMESAHDTETVTYPTTWNRISNTNVGGNKCQSICYGNGKFVISAQLGKTSYSTDGGDTWNVGGEIFSGSFANSIANDNGTKFVAVRDGSRIAYSSDGISWSKVTSPITQTLNCVCYGNGKFVAVGISGKGIYSSDGISWNAITDMKFGSSTINSVCYGNGKFVAVGDDNKGAYSTDGVSWTAIPDMKFTSGIDVYDIACWNNKFVAVGGAWRISYSFDGINWFAAPNEKTGSSGSFEAIDRYSPFFFAVGGTGGASPNALGAYSMDGVNWTFVDNIGIDRTPTGIAYGAGRFIIIGSNGQASYCKA